MLRREWLCDFGFYERRSAVLASGCFSGCSILAGEDEAQHFDASRASRGDELRGRVVPDREPYDAARAEMIVIGIACHEARATSETLNVIQRRPLVRVNERNTVRLNEHRGQPWFADLAQRPFMWRRGAYPFELRLAPKAGREFEPGVRIEQCANLATKRGRFAHLVGITIEHDMIARTLKCEHERMLPESGLSARTAGSASMR